MAHAAVAKLGVLVQGDDRARIVAASNKLLEGIARLRSAAGISGAAPA
jgi:hypothetical protein